MKISRTLTKGKQSLVVSLNKLDVKQVPKGGAETVESFRNTHEAGKRFTELVAKKLAADWQPDSKPADAAKLAEALIDQKVSWYDIVIALTDAELDVVAKWAAKDEQKVPLEAWRRRPNRLLLAGMLAQFDAYYLPDWTKAVKFVSKDPARAAWIVEVFGEALEGGRLSEKGQTFVARHLKKAAKGPAPKPVAPKKQAGSESSLLEAIARAPADDAPRLVYADWLLEQGNGFGEFIQRSCELAKMEDGPARRALQDTVEKLEAKHAKGWLEPIRGFIRSWSFERGFIKYLTCDGAKFSEAWEAIAARSPGAQLSLTGIKPKELGALAKSRLGTFNGVSLGSQRLDDAAIRALTAGSTFEGLDTLYLPDNAFTDEGLAMLGACASLKSLKSLGLLSMKPSFTAAGVTAVVSSEHLQGLESLGLSAQSITGAFVKARCSNLKELSLRLAHFSDDDARELSRVSMPKLTLLSIEIGGTAGFTMTDAGLKALLDAHKMAQLSTNHIASAGLKAKYGERLAAN